MFEHLFVSRENFRDFLRFKKFEVSEVPIVEDYFTLTPTTEVGYIMSINGTIEKLMAIVFASSKKSQASTFVNYVDHIFSIYEPARSFVNDDDKVTLSFIFKDNKVSIRIKNLLHIIVDNSEIAQFSVAGLEFSFNHTFKFEKMLVIFNQQIKEYFESTYKLPYGDEYVKHVHKIINTQYNLNAVRYQDGLNKAYDERIIGKYMTDHYVGEMLSSVMNKSEPLAKLVTEPTVDKSRKIEHDGKFIGFEKVTFPMKDLKKTEGLLNHVIINQWSKHVIQLVNAMRLYQSSMNGLDIKHISINMPRLSDAKKHMEHFELFNIVDDGINYNHHRNSFKIIFGLNIQVQVKDDSAIIYDHKFDTLDEAYIHFINYFKQRVLKRIPDHVINDNTFKLISMLNI